MIWINASLKYFKFKTFATSQSIYLLPAIIKYLIFLGGFGLVFHTMSDGNAFETNTKALIIGISQYSEINGLKYADDDARKFFYILTEFAGVHKNNATLLLNDKASKRRIEKEFDNLIQYSRRQSLEKVFIFFAGHGVKGGSVFLAPYDASTSDNKIYYTGKEFINETFINKGWLAKQVSLINSKIIFLIIDSCYSGVDNFGQLITANLNCQIVDKPDLAGYRGIVVIKRQANEKFDDMHGKKLAFLASSSKSQPSTEFDELGHGALSYCLLKYINCLRNKTPVNQIEQVSVKKLFLGVINFFKIEQISGRKLIEYQNPKLFPIPNENLVSEMTIMEIRGNRKLPLQNELRKPKKGILRLLTDPPGAHVYINDIKIDEKTNCDIELPVGKQMISIVLPKTGFRHSFVQEISDNTIQKKYFRLRGELKVTSLWEKDGRRYDGPNLDVYVGGVLRGRTSFKTNSLLAGSHDLEVRFSNEVKRKKIEIRPESPLTVTYIIIKTDSGKRKENNQLIRRLPM